MKLALSVDQVLSTTRSVRKRLDVTRPVSRTEIEECLELALQAPNGSNRNAWHWVVVDDRALIEKIAAIYKEQIGAFMNGDMTAYKAGMRGVERQDELLSSAGALVDILPKMPAILIPLVRGRSEKMTSCVDQANFWGSIVQSVWSFFLALRERGMASAWRTVTLQKEKDIADMLGIPYEKWTQVGMFPIAYTIGTEFKKAWRKPLSEVMSYNQFSKK
jgi:nitroreductase